MLNLNSQKNRTLRLYFYSAVLLVVLFPAGVFAETKAIIAFGDSLTAGCWNTEVEYSPCGIVPDPQYGYESYDYPLQLQTLLTENKYEYGVKNFGKGGETTFDALYRIDSVLESNCNWDAEYILIMEGTNDLLHNNNKEDIRFNLGVMIESSIAKGFIPLVATIPPDQTPGHDYKGIPEMNGLIRQLVEEKVAEGKNVILVDQFNALAPQWDSYTNPRSCYATLPGREDDQLHPNATGFSAMGSGWYESLAVVLPKPPRSFPWLILLLKTL
jgi:lysophospholipase L1-like esterase